MPALSAFIAPKNKHFGLSIGRTSLRGVELESSGKAKSTAEVLLPETVFQRGILVDKVSFVTHLKKLLSLGNFTTKYVGVCFSEAHAYSREYSLPIIPLSEVREAISWHLKDLFPFPEHQLYFDWKLLETTETEHKVIVVAVQKQVLDGMVEALIDSGLKPLGFQPGAAAVGKLLKFKPGQYALVTEVNRRGAYVTLVEGEKSLFTTVVNFIQSDTPDLYIRNICSTIIEIANYFQRKGTLKDKIPIILTGELASTAWAQQAKDLVPFPIQILTTPLQNPAFNKAYAVAASNIAPPEDASTINVLPTAIQKHYEEERRSAFYLAMLSRSLVVIIVLLVINVAAFVAVSIERQRMDQRVKMLSSAVTNQTTDMQELLLLNSQAQNIVALAPLRATVKSKLLVINSLLPETININQWDYDDAKLQFTLAGEAKDRSDLLVLKNKLEASGEFAKIALPLGSLESPINVRFSISFIVKK